jgi:hypothetical protein
MPRGGERAGGTPPEEDVTTSADAASARPVEDTQFPVTNAALNPWNGRGSTAR